MKNKNWVICIPVLSLILMATDGVGDNSKVKDVGQYELAQIEKERLLDERAVIKDSLEFYINLAKYNYSLSMGEAFREEHIVPGTNVMHVWYFRIVDSVIDTTKRDTVYVGEKTTKRP